MRKRSSITVTLAVAMAYLGAVGGVASARPRPRLDPFVQLQALGRGVNFGNELEADPAEGAWTNGLVIEEPHFSLARQAGFDSVRIPVAFSLHSLADPPYTIDPAFLARVEQVVGWGLGKGLRIVLDLHNYGEVQWDPQGQRQRFVALWRQIATRFRGAPDRLYYELLNEPNSGLTIDVWNDLAAEAVRAIREIDPLHTIVIDAVDYGNPDGLFGLRIPDGEENAIVTFHYYEPHLFTFQGKPWMGVDWSTTGITWPGPSASPLAPAPGVSPWVAAWLDAYDAIRDPALNPAGTRIIELQIDQAAAWARGKRYPLWMSEFTAQDGADLASRARWTSFVRRQLERNRIPWSTWTLLSDSGSKLYDVSTGRWTIELTEALGLNVRN
jgi:endoglucanase